jgi:hypothetical protein
VLEESRNMSWVETARLTVEKIKKNREETFIASEIVDLVQATDCERSELSEKRTIHINEATKLFKKKGWVQIYSGHLKQSIILLRDAKVKVPYPTLPQYTQAEIQSLKDLTLDELKTLHEAKMLFKGKIIS